MASNNNESGKKMIENGNPIQLLSPGQTREFQTRVESSNRSMRLFLIGCLLMVVTSSASPNHLGHETRLESFIDRADSATAERWAMSGFHSHGAGARCCHCGAQAGNLDQPDPEKWHFKQRAADCFLHRMLQIFMPNRDSMSDSEVASAASKFERIFKKFFPLIKDSAFAFVESFGFSTDEVALALFKHLVNADGSADGVLKFPRTGDLVKLLQSFTENELRYSGYVVGLVKNKIFELYYGSDSSNSLNTSNIQRQQTRIENELQPPQDQFTHQFEANLSAGQGTVRGRESDTRQSDDNPLCLQCGRNQRDRVLLPCGHLKFCRLCVQLMRNCPICGSIIICDIMAFLC